MELVNENIKPRDIVTREALEKCDNSRYGSLGALRTVLYIFRRLLTRQDLSLICIYSMKSVEKTPNLCHLVPAGNHFMEELHEAGGVSAVMKELTELDLIHKEQKTVTGKTVWENVQNAENHNPEIIRSIVHSYSETGGLAFLFGNIARNGCVVKRSAVAEEMQGTHLQGKSILRRRCRSESNSMKERSSRMTLW